MIKVALFDVDGVLIHIDFFTNAIERKYGISKELSTQFFTNSFEDCIIGKKDLKVEIEPYLNKWGWKGSVEAYLDEWFAYESKINTDLVNFIQKMRSMGIVCSVATNQEKYRVDYLFDKLGFANSFDNIYSSANFGCKKPEKQFYEKLLASLEGVKKDEILFWDDRLENIVAAKKAGINACQYVDFNNFTETMKKYV